MTTRVVSVAPDTTVAEVASRLSIGRISAVPVVDEHNHLVGIVSEGDLMRHTETGTDRARRSWWLELFADTNMAAVNYAKSHGRRARDVMTKDVFSIAPEVPLAEVAELLESKRIKRVPVLDGDRLVGIVSRADLVRGLAAMRAVEPTLSLSDETIRKQIVAELNREPWGRPTMTGVVVMNGVVELWGIAVSDSEQRAARVAAENVSGVKRVIYYRMVLPLLVGW